MISFDWNKYKKIVFFAKIIVGMINKKKEEKKAAMEYISVLNIIL